MQYKTNPKTKTIYILEFRSTINVEKYTNVVFVTDLKTVVFITRFVGLKELLTLSM